MAVSRGCHTCKARRIKCDETKPVCQQCDRANRICVAAPPKQRADLTIHAENEFASGRSKRPRGPRSSLIKQPQIDLETKALAYYHQFHLQTISNTPVTASGLAECVAYWQASGRSDEMVDLSLLSMALAVYSQTQQNTVAAGSASSKYYDLLQMVQKRISKIESPDFDSQDVDACLLTIFIMGRFEGVIHHPDPQDPRDAFKLSQTWSHHDGALAVLHFWSDKLGCHQPASEIVKQTRRGQIRSAIMRNRPVPDWLLDGDRYGERGLELEYDRAIVRLMIARQEISCSSEQVKLSMTELQRLYSEVEEIDTALRNWMEAVVSLGCPRSKHNFRKLHSTPKPRFYSTGVYSYSNRGHAAAWNQYYASRILTVSTCLRILDMELSEGSIHEKERNNRKRQKWSEVLNEMSDDVSASIPFFTGCVRVLPADSTGDIVDIVPSKEESMKPYLLAPLIWPLTVAASVPEIDPDQRRWLRSELAYFGKVCGGGLIASADTEQWTLCI